eukprot:gene30690-16820_t
MYRVPGVVFVPALWLYTGAAYAAVRLIVTHRGAADAVAGAL